jgi:hypothetical protein
VVLLSSGTSLLYKLLISFFLSGVLVPTHTVVFSHPLTRFLRSKMLKLNIISVMVAIVRRCEIGAGSGL